MQTIDINQALPQINQLLEIASTGQEIMITKNNQPMVKLVSTNELENNQKTTYNSPDSIQKLIEESEKINAKLTTEERVKKWLDFVASFPKDSANLPEEALHRDSMYD